LAAFEAMTPLVGLDVFFMIGAPYSGVC
jgi:hypothetical protein